MTEIDEYALTVNVTDDGSIIFDHDGNVDIGMAVWIHCVVLDYITERTGWHYRQCSKWD